MKPLKERCQDAEGVLEKVHVAIARKSHVLPELARTSLQSLVDQRGAIEHWKDTIAARDVARAYLAGLETRADGEGRVPYGSTPVKYNHARFLGTQSYLAISWSLADSITSMAGRVLCTHEAGKNGASPPQLKTHFVDTKREKTTAALMFASIKHSFAWPIAISYALRNHFIHDAGQSAAWSFFDGVAPASGFAISEKGWGHVDRTARTYDADGAEHRGAWPPAPRADLRVVFDFCEREMDDALGILLGSACQWLLSHVGLMIGED